MAYYKLFSTITMQPQEHRARALLGLHGNSVDLVIFACFNFREFVILELFAGSIFREMGRN